MTPTHPEFSAELHMKTTYPVLLAGLEPAPVPVLGPGPGPGPVQRTAAGSRLPRPPGGRCPAVAGPEQGPGPLRTRLHAGTGTELATPLPQELLDQETLAQAGDHQTFGPPGMELCQSS